MQRLQRNPLLVLGLCTLVGVMVLGPVFRRAYEDRQRKEAAPERYKKFFNLRFAHIQKRGAQAILIPAKEGWSDRFHPRSGSEARRQPLLVSRGTKLQQYAADSAPLFTIRDITSEGVVISGDHSKPFTLAWK
jgi:hypothetical protein